MADIKVKKGLFKNRDGEYLIPYVGDSVIDHRITNCLLEVPQRIKLELNGGILTLKAGSVVIVPNVFEEDGVTPKFEYVTIESDVSTNTGWVVSGQNVLFYDFVSKTLGMYGYNFANCDIWSGNSPTINKQYGIWFNTTNNIIQNTNNTGSSWAGKFSLPLAIYTCDSNKKPASIDQVFNGMGYMGSTAWVDKGVKGLIPNGRNEDRSLKNIELQTKALNTITYTNDIKGVLFGVGNDGRPTLNGAYTYDEKANYMYNTGQLWLTLVCGTYDVVGGKITNFQPKLPFRAVDYNDLTTTYPVPNYNAGVSMGDTFTAPSHGLVCCWGDVANTVYYPTVNGVRITIALGDNATGSTYCQVTFPVAKGDVVAGIGWTHSGARTFYPYKGVKIYD